MSLLDTIKVNAADGGKFDGKYDKSPAFPGGRKEWAFEWMGFNPPSYCYVKEDRAKQLNERYKKFRNCFDTHYGIGDFDYWKRLVINTLSETEKLELLHLLMEDNSASIKDREYLGIVDGNLTTRIDHFSDLTDFLKLLTPFECSHREWPHTHRCRYHNGFYCSDCNTFYDKNHPDYIRSEMLSLCGLGVHNLKADYYRAHRENEIPVELIQLEEKFNQLNGFNMFKVDCDEVLAIREWVHKIVKTYPIHKELREYLEKKEKQGTCE
jgi:hypothetical protein